MATGILPVSNIINVTIQQTPSGLAERNVNALALFTTEAPSNGEEYGIYISPAQVADIYGTASVTAAMANAIFGQTPNIRSGNGHLVVIPMQGAVSATRGNFVTANIAANISSLDGVVDGDIRVVVDGDNVDLTGLDFTGVTSLEQVAAILQSKLVDVTVSATDTQITFESKTVGASSSVDVVTLSGGSGTDLAGAGLLNAAGGTDTAGVDASGESLQDAITRTTDTVSYTGIITNLEMEDDVVLPLSAFIQARDKILLHHFSALSALGGVIADVQQAGNTKTRCILYTDAAQANLCKAAYAGRAFSVNFNGSDTMMTMNLKQLATILPDRGISQTTYVNANAAGADLYVSYDGVPSVYSTGGNDFFDNVYADLALKFALETAGFNHLRQTNTKVPQTERGMSGLKGAYAIVMKRFVTNGCLAGGSWASPETFGDPEIFKQNVLEAGYYIYSQPVTQQNQAEREQRKAPLVQIAAKRAGAIHTSDVIVVVND